MQQQLSGVCPNCFEPSTGDNFKFCAKCGSPLNVYAELDPINAIRAEGYMFRRAADQPNLLILIGMWVLLVPTFVTAALFAISANLDLKYAFPILVIGCFLPAAILFKTTRNYFRLRIHKKLNTLSFH